MIEPHIPIPNNDVGEEKGMDQGQMEGKQKQIKTKTFWLSKTQPVHIVRGKTSM